MLDWDEHNSRKIRAHRIKREEVEEALSNEPILFYEQKSDSEVRFVYYGETNNGSLLAMVIRSEPAKFGLLRPTI